MVSWRDGHSPHHLKISPMPPMGPLETPYGCYTLTRVFLGLDLIVSEHVRDFEGECLCGHPDLSQAGSWESPL